MELFLVLLLFGILLYATGQVILKSINLFESREKYRTNAILHKIEYREKAGTTIYHVTFDNKNGEKMSAKSLQYKGHPKFDVGDIIEIDYLIRDEMKNLIENELVDVIHPDHISIYQSFYNGPLKIINFISYFFLFASFMALILYYIN